MKRVQNWPRRKIVTTKLLWTPRARSDVKKIYIDIGKLQRLAAERYLARFRAKAERLR